MIQFLRSGDDGNIKIGYTKDPETLKKRLDTLQIGAPDLLHIIGTAKGTQSDEKLLHRKFFVYQLHGEWFQPDEALIVFINEFCGTKPIPEVGMLSSLGNASLTEIVSNIEQKYINKALKYARGNKAKAAKLLGITYRTIEYRMNKYKILT